MKKLLITVSIVCLAAVGYVVLTKDNTTNNQNSTTSTTGQSNSGTNTSSTATLDLSGQNLSQVPKDKLDNSKITALNVSNNNLTGALPAEIRKLTNLETLNASDNKLTGVPAEIGQLSKLKTANFANNNISGLPLEIGKLTKLETLDLRGNPNVSTYDIGLIQKEIPNTKILTD